MQINTVLHETFARVLFCGLAIFSVWFAGTNFLRFEMTEISAGNKFLRFSVQATEHLSGTLIFSTFIVRYVESQFTLLTY